MLYNRIEYIIKPPFFNKQFAQGRKKMIDIDVKYDI